MSKGYPFESAQQIRMRAIFEKNSRKGFYNKESSIDLQKFEERFERIQTKMKSHFEKHSPVWVGKETSKLLLKHRGQLTPQPSPTGFIHTETTPAAIAQRAYKAVENRLNQRRDDLEKIGERMRSRLNNTNNELENTSPKLNRGLKI